MGIVSFIEPIAASLLLVIVFQKAGFRGAVLWLCAAPVLGAVMWRVLFLPVAGYASPEAAVAIVALAVLPVSLLPLLVLAFKTWPPVPAASGFSEN